MNSTISVIIPAYNVDQYIEKCLCSVLSQTYKKLEVIVVNDGSTDGTADIIAEFAPDTRLVYIEQKNAGVTVARNSGIENATGDFLAFVDSDDYLEPEMYEELHAAFIAARADVAVCDYNLVYDDHVETKYSNMQDETIDTDMPGYFYNHCCGHKPNNYIWTRLYNADIVRKSGVRFENFKLGDDTLFNFKLLPYLKRATHISGAYYNYLQRSNSNVYTVARRSNLATVYADTFEALLNHYKSNGFDDFLQVMPLHAHTRLRSVVFYSQLAGLDEDNITKSINEGFQGREIVEYLRNSSGAGDYSEISALMPEMAGVMKRVIRDVLNDPGELVGGSMT